MSLILSEDDALAHYGILRRSGRYPWGSGGDPVQRSNTFLSMVADLRKTGMSDTEIARCFSTPEHPFNTTDLRNTTTIARNEKRAADQSQAVRLQQKGMSNNAIGRQMGINESSVRSLLAASKQDKVDILKTTTAMLKDQVDKKNFVDVGSGVENHLGISQTKLGTAVAALKDQGYMLHQVKLEQPGTGHKTEYKVLCKPGTTQKEAWLNRHNIQQITDFSDDGGRTFRGIKPPLSIKSKRVGVVYGEDGGSKADGVIFVRPGVKDVSLGAARYAQVRIMVDGTHYIKGMAVYKDDLPPGVDLLFHTNKSNTGNKLDALKPIKDDPENPFGSTIRQILHPETGQPTSVMNIVGSPTKEGSGAEGSWDKWSRTLSSQFLSKQTPQLAKSQLDMTFENKKADLDEIMSLTNPAVRKKLLEGFAEDCDSSAVHLKAAQLPRQANRVILPMTSKDMKETEVYAPSFKHGERVVLIRHPHAGTFEIPELIVNNKISEGRRLLGDVPDAIGIHPKVAEKLSGADFDGDSVLVIPNNSSRVKSSAALKELKVFDPKKEFPAYDGMKTMDGGTWNATTQKVEFPPGKGPSSRIKQQQMGDISNLITDMTIQGAPHPELARAVRHSMVVIDAEKHNLNYKESARVNNIAQLKTKYQGKANAGASTLISRATSEKRVPERKQGFIVDRATGKKIFRETGATYVDKRGRVKPKTTKSTKLAETDDARTLLSKNGGTKIEVIYADHSNRLKAMANEARKEAINTKAIPYSPSAKTAYAKEVKSLDDKLNVALKNRPLERQALVLANRWISTARQANPHMDEDEVKKLKQQSLQEARTRTGAGKKTIVIEPNEWHAIQAGAVTNTRLKDILDNADLDQVKQLATPRTNVLMTSTKTNRANAMLTSGYTQAEVASALGVSLSTLKRSLGEG